jgi:hypothetical protein
MIGPHHPCPHLRAHHHHPSAPPIISADPRAGSCWQVRFFTSPSGLLAPSQRTRRNSSITASATMPSPPSLMERLAWRFDLRSALPNIKLPVPDQMIEPHHPCSPLLMLTISGPTFWTLTISGRRSWCW